MICEGYGSKKGICKNKPVCSKNPLCRNCAGAKFEDKVANLFNIQGYSVKQNIKISSTQIDIFADIEYGFGHIGIIIECKYKFDSDASIDGRDIRVFSQTREIFNKKGVYGLATQAFFVTNGKISPDAYEVASECNVSVYTYNELIKRLMNFESYLKSIVHKFEESHLYNHYIELNCNNGNNAISLIKDFLVNQTKKGLVILGDYGSGKSSLSLKLCYELSKRKLAGKDYPIPLLIELRNYSKALDMEQLITSLFINKYDIHNGKFSTFYQLLKLGRFILIFDGFDEVAKRVDHATKYTIFNEICKYAIGHTKVIITCRGNFFNQKSEFEEIFKSSHLHFEPTSADDIYFEELIIDELNADQVDEYILSYEDKLSSLGFSTNDFRNIINNTHDLTDLSKRPVLLSIIVDTIPRLSDKHIGKINTAKLYNEYTSIWIRREEEKGKTLIKSSDKIMFAKNLAFDMFMNNELSIHFSKIPDEVKLTLKIDDISDIDYFSHDIKSCSFLTRDDLGYYRFIHKSFMEYFAAIEILSQLFSCITYSGDQLVDKINTILGKNLITLEIGLFIYDLFEINYFNEKDFSSLYNKLDINKLSPTAFKNSVSVLSKTKTNISVYLKELHKDFIDLSDTDLSYSVFNHLSFSNSKFIGAIFYNSNIASCLFTNCEFTDCLFSKTSSENSVFIKSFFDFCSFKKSSFSNCDFSYSILAESDIRESRFVQCAFNYTDFSGFVYDASSDFQDSDMDNSMGTY